MNDINLTYMNNISKHITNTKELFKNLGMEKSALTEAQTSFLNDNGYLIIPPTKFIRENLKKMNEITNNLIKSEGDKGGWEGKEKFYKKGKFFEANCDRLGNLIEKDLIFGKLIQIPEILSAAHEVIKDEIKVGGLNFRNPHKGYGEQAIHIDGIPRQSIDEKFHGVVCYIYLDDATKENGATRIIPKTHKKTGWPDDYINTNKRHEDEIRVETEAGSIVVFNLNTWHAGAENTNGKPRKTIFIQIKKRDEGQLLNYKKFLSIKTKKALNAAQKYLLAVRDEDPTQQEDSVSVGQFYRDKFGKDRGAIK